MRAVILAGGKGTRLRPFTTSFPKPLMPVGDIPILEIVLRQLRMHGVTDVTMLTGHLAYLLEGYFTDGSHLGMKIEYIREENPLGTAGPLRSLTGKVFDDFFVMNGDLLCNMDFSALMKQHKSEANPVTVSTYVRSEKIELGVLKVAEGGRVYGYEEKPTLRYDVSMGVYAMSPAVLERIPDGFYDMPTLILDLLAAGFEVGSRRHDGLWLDIGRPDDYDEANYLFRNDPELFLPGYAPPSR
jgi:NDP-sugar pyrophosphorylase family protein